MFMTKYRTIVPLWCRLKFRTATQKTAAEGKTKQAFIVRRELVTGR